MSSPFPQLSAYADFLLQNHLDDFTRENIALAKEFSLPANKVIFGWEEQKYFDFIKRRTEIFLKFFKERDPLALAITELYKWRDDNMPQVSGRVLSMEDLSISYSIRKVILTRNLSRFTQDIKLYEQVILEFETFYREWKKELFKVMLELHNKHLLDEIADRTAELLQKNKELERMNKDLDNFIYTASHDLKTPVSNIEGLVYTLQDVMGSKGLIDADLDQIIHLMNRSVKQFQGTIKELTEISKIQKNHFEDIEEIELEHIYEEVKHTLSKIITSSGAQISLNCIDCQRIRFSKVNLRSIIFNLISNAIKYSDPQRPPKIELLLFQDGDHKILVVKDNGLGIKKEHHDKIFQMFKRMHTHVEGTGVGLYLVKRMMENAGGSVSVESKEGLGSSFRLRFTDSLKGKVEC